MRHTGTLVGFDYKACNSEPVTRRNLNLGESEVRRLALASPPKMQRPALVLVDRALVTRYRTEGRTGYRSIATNHVPVRNDDEWKAASYEICALRFLFKNYVSCLFVINFLRVSPCLPFLLFEKLGCLPLNAARLLACQQSRQESCQELRALRAILSACNQTHR